jgi:hypothetical protein
VLIFFSPEPGNDDVDINAAYSRGAGKKAPNISTRHLLRFFTTSAWKKFDDSDKVGKRKVEFVEQSY